MKKFIAIALAAVVLVCLAACGGTADAPKLEGVEAPVDILNTVWTSYAEDEKFFAMGGDMNNIVDNAPGKFDIADTESLAAQLVCSDDAAAMVDGAASLMHAMNANTFTGAAYHLADANNKDAFVAAMKDGIKNNQWLCGFPETVLIASLADYVVVAFGAGDIVENFKTKLTTAYDITTIEVDEAVA